jgi:hypothetical protein
MIIGVLAKSCDYLAQLVKGLPVIATVVPTTNRRVTGLGQGATVSTPRS